VTITDQVRKPINQRARQQLRGLRAAVLDARLDAANRGQMTREEALREPEPACEAPIGTYAEMINMRVLR
jgi:hypothetical protein